MKTVISYTGTTLLKVGYCIENCLLLRLWLSLLFVFMFDIMQAYRPFTSSRGHPFPLCVPTPSRPINGFNLPTPLRPMHRVRENALPGFHPKQWVRFFFDQRYKVQCGSTLCAIKSGYSAVDQRIIFNVKNPLESGSKLSFSVKGC